MANRKAKNVLKHKTKAEKNIQKKTKNLHQMSQLKLKNRDHSSMSKS